MGALNEAEEVLDLPPPRRGKCFLRLEGIGGWGQGRVELSTDSHVADPGPESGDKGPARA